MECQNWSSDTVIDLIVEGRNRWSVVLIRIITWIRIIIFTSEMSSTVCRSLSMLTNSWTVICSSGHQGHYKHVAAQIPCYTAKLSYRHPPQLFRHKSPKVNLNSPVGTAIMECQNWSSDTVIDLIVEGRNRWSVVLIRIITCIYFSSDYIYYKHVAATVHLHLWGYWKIPFNCQIIGNLLLC
jgi:hypothetical protein